MKINDSIREFLENIFNSIGIEPLYGITFIGIIYSLYLTKDVNRWETIPKETKQWNVILWLATIFIFIVSIFNYLR